WLAATPPEETRNTYHCVGNSRSVPEAELRIHAGPVSRNRSSISYCFQICVTRFISKATMTCTIAFSSRRLRGSIVRSDRKKNFGRESEFSTIKKRFPRLSTSSVIADRSSIVVVCHTDRPGASQSLCAAENSVGRSRPSGYLHKRYGHSFRTSYRICWEGVSD